MTDYVTLGSLTGKKIHGLITKLKSFDNVKNEQKAIQEKTNKEQDENNALQKQRDEENKKLTQEKE
jgi:hypothetical protein